METPTLQPQPHSASSAHQGCLCCKPRPLFGRTSILQSERGQSLIQLMLGVAIMSIVGFTFANMFSQQQRSLNQSTQKLASTDLYRIVSSALSDTAICTAMLRQPGINTTINIGSLNATTSISLNYIPASTALAPNPVPKVLVKTSSGGGQALASNLSTSLKVSNIEITDIGCPSATCTNSSNSFTANLTVTFSQTDQIGSLAPIRIPITLKDSSNSSSAIKTLDACGTVAAPATCTSPYQASNAYGQNCTITPSGTGTNSGSTLTGTCDSRYTGSCSATCTNGTWTNPTDTCTPIPCSATSIGNCTLPSAAVSGSPVSGSCPATYSGSCSAFCDLGPNWRSNSNTCTPPPPCAATTTSYCSLPSALINTTQNGTCSGGTVGSCSYTCMSNSTWGSPASNSCAPPGCTAQTVSSCSLTSATSGTTRVGTCSGGTVGSCSYTCSWGSWTSPASNTCAAPGCNTTIVANCSLSAASSGTNRIGACVNGTVGSCNYTCSWGSWTSPASNTCVVPPAPCNAKTVSNCSLAYATSGTYRTGTCVNGTVGSCGYTCNNGSWGNYATNSCVIPPAPCGATTLANCSLAYTTSGVYRTGTCVNGTVGSCGYTCNNGSWGSYATNSCAVPPPPPGSITYSTPGTYTFTVPRYNNGIRIEVVGGGGGGQSCGCCICAWWFCFPMCYAGNPGSYSAFGGIVGYGGAQLTPGGGAGGNVANLTGLRGNWNGSNCHGYGGGNGSNPYGTANGGYPGGGGLGQCVFWGANGGGGGGYARADYIGYQTLAVGARYTVVVGSGGAYRGANGMVYVYWW